MRFDKLTTKFQQALADAQSLALGNDNGFIEPQHMLAALLAQEDGGTASIVGIAKGVGMIHPRMATMLSIVLTDATVDPATLWGLLRPAAARTWDQLSVDGDTSTNDTVFVLASGAAGAVPVQAGSPEAEALGSVPRISASLRPTR